MADTGTCSHPLKLVRTNHSAAARRITVFERSVDDIGENLHVLMRVSTKPLPRPNKVFIDHQQVSEPVVAGIEIPVERECMIAIEPTRPRLTALGGMPYHDHTSIVTAARHSPSICRRLAQIFSKPKELL